MNQIRETKTFTRRLFGRCFCLILIAVISVTMLSACGKKEEQTTIDNNAVTELPQQENPQQQEEGTGVSEEFDITNIDVYGIDESTLERVATSVAVEKDTKITPESVLNAVLLALEDSSVQVEINSVVQEGNKVTVDIKAENPYIPLGNCGSTLEGNVLECMAMSLLDNLENCQEVYFTVNGAEYESGHIYIPMDEPYATKQ